MTTATRLAITYRCGRCGRRIILHIQPSQPPACACRPGRAATVMTVEDRP